MSTIHLKPSFTLKHVQHEFERDFPSLKFEFFKKAHHEFEISNPKQMYFDRGKQLEEIGLTHSVSIDYTPQTKAWDFEKSFEEKAGLHIQVFRKSGDVWLETGQTDEWTLEELNKQGEEGFQPTASAEEVDYREQE